MNAYHRFFVKDKNSLLIFRITFWYKTRILEFLKSLLKLIL